MMLFEGVRVLNRIKDLYQVFTNKLLFIEWILQILRSTSIYFLNIKSRIEADEFTDTNEEIDMRTASPGVKRNIIYDEKVLNMRWDLCLSCEFLTESHKCTKCGCFMSVKHKLSHAVCPIGKWEKHTEEAINGTYITS